jgi:hypothetical protein
VFDPLSRDRAVSESFNPAIHDIHSGHVPDFLGRLATDAAVKEQTTVDQIVPVALSSQLSAWRVRSR